MADTAAGGRLDDLDQLREVLLHHRLALDDDRGLRADRVVDLCDLVCRPRDQARACVSQALPSSLSVFTCECSNVVNVLTKDTAM